MARMLRKTLASLSVVMVAAYCQSYPRFEIRGKNLLTILTLSMIRLGTML